MPLSLISMIIRFAVFILDVAVFFVVVRLYSILIPAREILFLDRIGSPFVNAVTRVVRHFLKRYRQRPLSQRQEEVVALVALLTVRWVLRATMR